jgi:hypothetical protein
VHVLAQDEIEAVSITVEYAQAVKDSSEEFWNQARRPKGDGAVDPSEAMIARR